jgi:hypothetical protein
MARSRCNHRWKARRCLLDLIDGKDRRRIAHE